MGCRLPIGLLAVFVQLLLAFLLVLAWLWLVSRLALPCTAPSAFDLAFFYYCLDTAVLILLFSLGAFLDTAFRALSQAVAPLALVYRGLFGLYATSTISHNIASSAAILQYLHY